MTLKSNPTLFSRARRFGILGMLLAVGTLIGYQMIAGPTVIANQAPEQPLQTLDQEAQPGEMEVFQPAGQAAENNLPQFLRFGEVQLRPHLSYRMMYGSGVQSAPGNSEDTLIQEFSPGIVIDLGKHWALDYTPTMRFYSTDKFKDTVDHSISLTGGFDYDAWRFGIAHSSTFTSAPLVETAQQTDQSTHSTSLTASRVLNSSMSADFSLNQSIALVSGLEDSYDWNTLDWLNYRFWPRLNAGIGIGGGYVLVEGNGQANGLTGLSIGNQTYEELEARVNWRATSKISFQVNGGLEDRQFMSGNSDSSLNPIFGAAIQYQPFKDTEISLNASRTISSSDYYLAAQQTEATIVGINLSQRLLRKFNLSLGVTYTREDYDTASGAIAANVVNRSDDVYGFNARLSHPFLKRGTWSVFYQYSEDTSSRQGYSFRSNQIGFEVTYSY